MEKILFVCLGNICRSPLAEGIMLHLKDKHDLNIEVDSAGTANYHIGESPDRRTIVNARKNGIDLSTLKARQFVSSDFDKFDRIFVMDTSNLKNVIALSTNSDQTDKVQLLLIATGNKTLSEVPDPYYGGEASFESVFQLLFSACEQLRLQLNK